MEILHRACAGIDIGKRSVTVCAITSGPSDEPAKATRTFGTLTRDLLERFLLAVRLRHLADLDEHIEGLDVEVRNEAHDRERTADQCPLQTVCDLVVPGMVARRSITGSAGRRRSLIWKRSATTRVS
jgi:hypothetical protein